MIKVLDDALLSVAGPLGVDIDPLKLVVTLALSFPFCAILKRLPDSEPLYKQLFCLGYVTVSIVISNIATDSRQSVYILSSGNFRTCIWNSHFVTKFLLHLLSRKIFS